MNAALLAAGAGILIAGGYMVSLSRVSANLETTLRTRLHKVLLTGIEINIDATLKNPTDKSLRIKFPYVKILHNQEIFGSSQVVDKDIEIPAYGQAVVQGILIHIPMMKLLKLGGEVIQQLKDGKVALNFEAHITSSIQTALKDIPYQTTETITVQKQF